MTHITFVVSRNQLDILRELTYESRVPKVNIIVDRRQNERRQDSHRTDFPDRRYSERRRSSNSRDLELIGLAVVVTGEPFTE
jgi:hypothetical protein